MTTVLTVYAGKGGVGKTTTAINLAYQLGKAGHKTLLIDANAKQPSAQVVYDTIKGDVPFDLAVEDKPELLAHVRRLTYDYIVIDCPPSPEEAKAALDVADLIIVVFVPKFLETRAITDTIRLLANLPFRVLVVGVSYAMRGRVKGARAMMAGFDQPMFATSIRAYAVYENAQALGIPLFVDEAKDQLGAHLEDALADNEAVYKELMAVLDGTQR